MVRKIYIKKIIKSIYLYKNNKKKNIISKIKTTSNTIMPKKYTKLVIKYKTKKKTYTLNSAFNIRIKHNILNEINKKQKFKIIIPNNQNPNFENCDTSTIIILNNNLVTNFIDNFKTILKLYCPEKNILVLDKISRQYLNCLYIIPLIQLHDKLPIYYISIQLEQLKSCQSINDNYYLKLKNSVAVFDYAEENIPILKTHNIKNIFLQMLPINKRVIQVDQYKYDVLFMGELLPRRLTILNYLKTIFNIKIISDCFGNKINKYLKKSKIILNIHACDYSLLEINQLFESFVYKNIIISEKSDNNFIMYNNDVQFVDIIKPDLSNISVLVDKINFNLSNFNPLDRSQIINKIYNISQSDLERNLYSLKIINNYNVDVDADKIICLYLKEYPARYTNFKKYNDQYINKISFFNGIKSDIPGEGCKNSYILLLDKLKNYSISTICEEDVYFPYNFDEIYNSIKTYLLSLNSFDLFCGIVAVFEKHTKVIKVDKVNNITFVHVTQFTSTVFNIFSKKGCNLLLNNSNNSQHIDRMIENLDNNEIITTYPYYFTCLQSVSSNFDTDLTNQYNIWFNESLIFLKTNIIKLGYTHILRHIINASYNGINVTDVVANLVIHTKYFTVNSEMLKCDVIDDINNLLIIYSTNDNTDIYKFNSYVYCSIYNDTD